MKSILFNAEMVRAILAERKSVTRLAVKPQPEEGAYSPYEGVGGKVSFRIGERGCTDPYKPPYRTGDILYVQERWQYKVSGGYLYEALYNMSGRHPLNWYSGISMPKEAARLFLRVTDVRVERLQDITSSDCEKEGVDLTDLENLGVGVINHEVYTQEFQALWDSTIKKSDLFLYGWAANPWVFVIEFERISKEAALQKEKS